jgi:hypothetical protein
MPDLVALAASAAVLAEFRTSDIIKASSIIVGTE